MRGGSGSGQNSAAHAVILRRGSGQCDGTGRVLEDVGDGDDSEFTGFRQKTGTRGHGDWCQMSWRGVVTARQSDSDGGVKWRRSSASVTALCSYRHATITQQAQARSQARHDDGDAAAASRGRLETGTAGRRWGTGRRAGSARCASSAAAAPADAGCSATRPSTLAASW
jgi:hypothetical protein